MPTIIKNKDGSKLKVIFFLFWNIVSQIMFWASGFSLAACSCELAEELFTVTSVVRVELFPLLL